MFKKIIGIFDKSEKEVEVKSAKTTSTKPDNSSTPTKVLDREEVNPYLDEELFDPLPKVISQSGRVPLEFLKEVAIAMDEVDFIQYMKHPILAGSGVEEGTLTANNTASSSPTRVRQKTMMFIPTRKITESVKDAAEGVSLQQACYALIKKLDSATRTSKTFFIGREPENDLVIPDFSISKKHARIEIKGNEYLLADLGSSNGTRVNGTLITNSTVTLKDKDKVAFSRFEFTLLFPASLQGILRK